MAPAAAARTRSQSVAEEDASILISKQRTERVRTCVCVHVLCVCQSVVEEDTSIVISKQHTEQVFSYVCEGI
jgi:hypothetical protein